MDDSELLRLYATERSEKAFAELVRRHLGLVYHAALRQCGGDSHRAEDVAQTVFTDLARKAKDLSARPVLAGWLYTSARYAAAQAVRTEVRRQTREAEAVVMNEPETAVDWEQLRPVIDEALDALGEPDREAVLLRFFEGRPFAEIGRQFTVSEDAARMRVDRALEKMRGVLARHGVTSTAAALGAALAGQAVAAVPAGLAASITGAALGGGAAAATIIFMSITKLQAAAIAAVMAAGVAGLFVQHRTNTQLQADLDFLRTENQHLTQAAQELKQARSDRAQPPQIRDEVANSSAVAPAAAVTAKPTAAPTTRPLAPGLLPVDALGNAGIATPRAAWSTQLWAARTGDLMLEASTLSFTPEGRKKLEALATDLPADLRAQYDTAEKIMALALAANPHPVAGMQVISETSSGPDDMVLQTQWQHADDDIVHKSDVHLHRDAEGWKIVMPMSIVDRAAAYLSRDVSSGSPRK